MPTLNNRPLLVQRKKSPPANIGRNTVRLGLEVSQLYKCTILFSDLSNKKE